jgi:hypothetical protein
VKTDAPPIAKIDLVRVRPSGERITLTVEIGQPYQSPEGVWQTPVALHGLDGRLSDICGEDSLQSLCVAVKMVHLRLASIIDAGDRLQDAEGGAFPFDAYFAGS